MPTFSSSSSLYPLSDIPPTNTTPSPTTALSNVSTPSSSSSTKAKHDVATFAGAVGGSAGLLAILALGLCISIRRRRWRSAQRERRTNAGYAQPFTAFDHGHDEDDEENGLGASTAAVPVMAQAGPAPFVPRYFPGTLPSSPPPYPAGGPVVDRGNTPPPPPLPMSLPPPLTRTDTGSYSYADRPPPTPPDGVPPPFGVAITQPPVMISSPVFSTILSSTTPTTTFGHMSATNSLRSRRSMDMRDVDEVEDLSIEPSTSSARDSRISSVSSTAASSASSPSTSTSISTADEPKNISQERSKALSIRSGHSGSSIAEAVPDTRR